MATSLSTYAGNAILNAIDAAGLTNVSGPDGIAAAAARLVENAAVDRVVLTGDVADVADYLTKLVERVRDDADYLDA